VTTRRRKKNLDKLKVHSHTSTQSTPTLYTTRYPLHAIRKTPRYTLHTTNFTLHTVYTIRYALTTSTQATHTHTHTHTHTTRNGGE
jgi:hypothetical protein